MSDGADDGAWTFSFGAEFFSEGMKEGVVFFCDQSRHEESLSEVFVATFGETRRQFGFSRLPSFGDQAGPSADSSCVGVLIDVGQLCDCDYRREPADPFDASKELHFVIERGILFEVLADGFLDRTDLQFEMLQTAFKERLRGGGSGAQLISELLAKTD